MTFVMFGEIYSIVPHALCVLPCHPLGPEVLACVECAESLRDVVSEFWRNREKVAFRGYERGESERTEITRSMSTRRKNSPRFEWKRWDIEAQTRRRLMSDG